MVSRVIEHGGGAAVPVPFVIDALVSIQLRWARCATATDSGECMYNKIYLVTQYIGKAVKQQTPYKSSRNNTNRIKLCVGDNLKGNIKSCVFTQSQLAHKVSISKISPFTCRVRALGNGWACPYDNWVKAGLLLS